MMRLVLFLLGVLALAAGLSWLADQPGTLLITWHDYKISTSVFRSGGHFRRAVSASRSWPGPSCARSGRAPLPSATS